MEQRLCKNVKKRVKKSHSEAEELGTSDFSLLSSTTICSIHDNWLPKCQVLWKL